MRSLVHAFSLSLFLFSCARQPTLTAEMAPTSLNAVNLEETLSQRDELMMAYSLTSYDAQNKAVAVVNGGWGVQVVRTGQQFDLQSNGPAFAKPIGLPIPRNGRVVASLILVEVDDYERANQLLDQVRRIHNVVAIPAGLLLTAVEVLTPLKYVSAGLIASGIGLKLVDRFDTDDLLGQSSVDLREADLRARKQPLVRVPVVFTGQHLRDTYRYELRYDIRLKTAQIQPIDK
ncbi:MAG: hypothetical protein H7319_08665 [Spirosoma sp.]|nr:hypothetical protein [Spirosoma sp.]